MAKYTLRNIGPVSSAWLLELGIETVEDLKAYGGAVPAYRMVRMLHPAASLNLLWALEAAIRELDWRQLPEDAKGSLLEELEAMDRA